MTQIKNFDLTSVRGQRQVAEGITTAEGKLPLIGFNFIKRAILEDLLSDYSYI